ncbi:hypothetical protein RchiOBHm_Chr5g0067761 [Rosa chinensis]|uniref:Uncharacterized protein n=1 Tax=Rosa chinensis TaxID=74649 RepID=A0A2P6QJJ6_ROSCH|nr:hypothetical protein RchiOBHm_Chr5g0067761 [Rosa chinensis]
MRRSVDLTPFAVVPFFCCFAPSQSLILIQVCAFSYFLVDFDIEREVTVLHGYN